MERYLVFRGSEAMERVVMELLRRGWQAESEEWPHPAVITSAPGRAFEHAWNAVN